MSLNHVVMVVIRWFFSIGARFIKVVPCYTAAVVLATLVSQLTLLLAFFLPLKVIILLSSLTIPRYLPQIWQDVGYENLIMFLSAGAFVFYLVHLIADKLVDIYTEKGANCLLEMSQKGSLFANQSEVARRAYHRYSHSLASLIFIGFSLTCIGILYPNLLFVLVMYAMATYMFVLLVGELNATFHSRLEKNISSFMKAIGGLGFLLSFIFIVVDFLRGTPPSVIVLLICLLIVRQLMNRMTRLVVDIIALHVKRIEVNTLFFHGQVVVPNESKVDREFWSLLEPFSRDQWVAGVLSEVVGVSPTRVDCVWLQTSIANEAVFEIASFDDKGCRQGIYLLKLFNSKRCSIAMHEFDLLAECGQGALPSLHFLGASKVGRYHCHLFDWTGMKVSSTGELGDKVQDVASCLLTYEPPEEILNRYRSSRPSLSQRLNEGMVERLRLVAALPEQIEHLAVFEKKFYQIQQVLSYLPLQIYNPDAKIDMLTPQNGSGVKLMHWGRWSVEPIGAGWHPVTGKGLARLMSELIVVKKRREALISVRDLDVRLAALMFSFEQFYNRQRYVRALVLLPAIIECLEGGVETDGESLKSNVD